MIMLKSKLALALVLALAGTAAIAGPRGPGPGPRGCMMGSQATTETCQGWVHERHEARVKAADADNDGAISKAEAEKFMPGLAPHFDAVDTDKDGKVTVAELDAAHGAGLHSGPGYCMQRAQAPKQ
jgi:EF hand